jgi:hypothetical protein
VERAQERILAHVVGLVRSDDPRGDPKDNIPVALDECLECPEIAAPRPRDERAVGIGLLDDDVSMLVAGLPLRMRILRHRARTRR